MAYNIFLSHKHSDARIAVELAKFLRQKSGGRVQVHLSSDSRFSGPKFGKNLNAELRTALWDTDAFVLLYTTGDQDWSYCMWECGMATDPQSPDTAVIVFQCGTDVPGPLMDTVRVNARKYDDILKFTQALFLETFFTQQTEPLCPGWKESDCEEPARELFEVLQRVLPMHDQSEVFSPWPSMCIEMPTESIGMLEAERSRAAEIIQKTATVSGDARAAEIFGLTSFGVKRLFGDVLDQWVRQFPERPTNWLGFCCEQIAQGAARELPVVRCAPIKDSAGQAEFTPLLTLVRRVPWEGKMLFDFALYDLSDPRGTLVTERMLAAGEIFSRRIGSTGPSAMPLRTLRQEMKSAGKNRVPLVTESNAVIYVIHRSTIDAFLLDCGLDQPTVQDLLNEPGNSEAFERSFAIVAKGATLADAAGAMTSQCSDVFVTEHGRKDEPLLGWLTNADLTRSGTAPGV
ncbi:MAG: hypothetical protein ABMA15_27715 [Vicinamibacterales bacterium]